jgi:hypothetical protein
MSKTPKSDAAAFRVNAYLQAVPLRLSQELENERAACHAAFIFEKDRNIINERENARLREALKWAEPYVPKRADCETRRMIESLLPNVQAQR